MRYQTNNSMMSDNADTDRLIKVGLFPDGCFDQRKMLNMTAKFEKRQAPKPKKKSPTGSAEYLVK